MIRPCVIFLLPIFSASFFVRNSLHAEENDKKIVDKKIAFHQMVALTDFVGIRLPGMI